MLADWSIRAPRETPGGPLNFNFQKNFDTSCSMGPCIAVGEADPTNIDMETLVNGGCRQRFNRRTGKRKPQQCHAGRLWSVRPPPEGVGYLWRLCVFAPERVGRSWLVSPRVTSVEIALRPTRPLFGAGSLSVLAVSARDSLLPTECCQPPKARRAKVYVACAWVMNPSCWEIKNRYARYSERILFFHSWPGDGGKG